MSDSKLIQDQASQRDKINNRLLQNHPPSKSPALFLKGNLVCIRNERTKNQPRPRYIVDRIDGNWLFLHKLTDNQLRAKLYKVHQNACIRLPHSENETVQQKQPETSSDSDSDSDYSASETEELTSLQPSSEDLPDDTAMETPSPIIHDERHPRPPRDRKPPPWLKDYARE